MNNNFNQNKLVTFSKNERKYTLFLESSIRSSDILQTVANNFAFYLINGKINLIYAFCS